MNFDIQYIIKIFLFIFTNFKMCFQNYFVNTSSITLIECEFLVHLHGEYNLVQTPHKFIIAKLSVHCANNNALQIESFVVMNLCCACTK